MALFKAQAAELRAVRTEVFEEVAAANERNGGEVQAG